MTSPDNVQQAEECRGLHRIPEECQFLVSTPLQDIRDGPPVVLVLDLQCPGCLLPPQDQRVELHLSHKIKGGFGLNAG